MTPDEIRSYIFQILEDDAAFVTVDGADGRHFSAVIVSRRFEGLSSLNRHRLIMSALSEKISSGLIHALSLETITPSEWEKKSK